MPFVVFEGERKLAELVDRVFGPNLTVAERKRAVSALQRANPQLGDLAAVARGSIVVVPRVPGLAPAARRADAGENPAREAMHEISRALDAHRQDLAESLESASARLDAVRRILDSDEVRRAAAQEPGGEAQLEGIAAATAEREADHERARGALDEMASTTRELLEFADRL